MRRWCRRKSRSYFSASLRNLHLDFFSTPTKETGKQSFFKNGRVYPFLITSLVVNVTSCKANYGVVRICRTDFSWTSSEMSGILRGKKKYVDVLHLVHAIHPPSVSRHRSIAYNIPHVGFLCLRATHTRLQNGVAHCLLPLCMPQPRSFFAWKKR